MTKTYTYIIKVDFDFDNIIDSFGSLKSGQPTLKQCEDAVEDYVASFDDAEYYIVNNTPHIAHDLYNYIYSKNN